MTNRKNWPVGLSTSHFGSLAHRESEVFSECRKAGIRVAELSQTYEALVEAGFYDRPKRISDAAAAEGVTLRSLHLPFSKALHIDHPDDEADRAAVLASLESVSLVVVFQDKVPLKAVELAHPDIYVKGGDYRIEDLPEAKLVSTWGARTVTVQFEHERSTTALLKKVRGA